MQISFNSYLFEKDNQLFLLKILKNANKYLFFNRFYFINC